MKKYCCLLLCVIFLSAFAAAAAADEAALPGTSASLAAGAYKAGTDFPEGAYTVRCGDPEESCCFSFGSLYMKGLAAPGSYLSDGSFEICLYSAPDFRLYFDKNDVLKSSYPLTLTVPETPEILRDQQTAIESGIYWIGKDIPAGSYALKCAEGADGCCFSAAAKYMDKLAPDNEYLHDGYYETCLFDDETSHLYLDSNDVLRISGLITISLAAPVETGPDARIELDKGIYWIGTDIPAGSYTVRCREGDYGCRFFLASDSLIRLSDPYSEEMFQHIDVYIDEGEEYHVFFEEDGVFQTGSPLLLSEAEAVSFE